MNSTLPFALIIGAENFVAKRLAEELSKKDLNVVGVGDYVTGWEEIKNSELVSELEEVEGKFNYVFDFRGESNNWERKEFWGEKITLITVNNPEKTKELINSFSFKEDNWRIIEAVGVYGPDMEEKGILAMNLRAAVKNQNLILPAVRDKFRILAVDDLVEAILRASFLSGTEREVFLVAGREIDSEEVARVLIDEAKMTKYKVIQRDLEIEKVDEEKLAESVNKLRWQPKVEFKDGVVKTLQYFFSKIDEENRKGKIEKSEKVYFEPIKIKKTETKNNFMEVMVEPIPAVEIQNPSKSPFDPPEGGQAIKGDLSSNQNPSVPMNIGAPRLDEREAEIKVEEVPDSGWDWDINNFKNKKITPIIDQDEEKKETKELIDKEEEEIDQEFDDVSKPMIPSINSEHPPAEVVVSKRSHFFSKFKINGLGIKILLFVVIFSLMFVPINWVLSSISVYRGLNKTLVLIENKKYAEAENVADKNLNRAKKIDEQIDSYGLNKLGLIRNYQSLIKIATEALTVEKETVSVAKNMETISQTMFKDKKADINQESTKLKNNLNNLKDDLGLLLARLNGDYNWLPTKIKTLLNEKTNQLTKINTEINLMTTVTDILPEMLGADGKKREYMVLFQNESELRATGGFVGSYGMLSFQNGKLLNFEVKDVYDADGQLKGHVEPPAEIKNYLGEAGWFMRDANWNPDFATSANDIQWFLDKELGKSVDGVLGINLATAKSIVAVIGEISVPDFKEKINKDNLYEQAEYYSETQFFPGSNQKASFLGSLGKQLVEEIRNLDNKKQLLLAESIIDLLESNEIQLAFNNTKVQTTVKSLGWDGSLFNGKCAKENCMTDYLYLVESNLGVNKANYFLYRNIEQTVDIGKQKVNRMVKINYENTAKNSNWPGGDYKNYLRIYLPNDISLSQVAIYDTNNITNKKVYSNEELKVQQFMGKTEVGFLITVPVLSKKTVEISYTSQNNLTDNFSYVNYIQKQSGFGDTGIVSLVSYPDGWQPLSVEPQASVVSGKLLFNQKLDKDIKIGVELGK